MATPIVTALAVYEAGKKAYEAYQGIVAFVSLGSHSPTPEEEILARLEVLHQDFVALQGRFDEVLEAVKQAVRVEQQAYVLNLRRDLDGLRGRARTAMDELNAWVADGRKDPLLRSNADNNSRLAANTLLEGDSYFYRPDPNTPESVFDHRLAYIAYVYVLTVRFGVIAGLNPQYREDRLAREELTRHAARLDWVFQHADQAIEPHTGGGPDGRGSYFLAHQCVDHITGYDTGHTEVGWRLGGQAEYDDARGYYSDQLRADMRVRTGLAKLIGFHDTVAYWAKDPRTPGWSPWAPVEVPDSMASLVAASDRPGRTVLVWQDPDKAQLRTTSYDSTATAPAWKPSVAISAENTVRREPTPRAVSSGPGLITVVMMGKDGGIYATRTDPTRPTGWLDAPVRVSGDATDVSYAEAAATPGSVVVVWRDNGTSTLMAAFQDAKGVWGPPQAATPADAASLGSDLTVACPSPGVVLVVWTMNDRTLHCVTYDAHAAHPAWSAPAQIAEFPGNDFPSSIQAMGTGDGKADVVWQGTFGSLWNIHYDGGWSAPAEITPQHLTKWGVPYTTVPAVTGDRRAHWFWLGRDSRVQTIYRDPQASQWSAPLRLGQPWWSYAELAAVPTAARGVSLYRVDFGSEIGEVPKLQTCFYDPATPTASARIADARALVTRAQTLCNLPGPAREEANARAADAIAVAREVVAQDPGYRATLAQWLVFPAGTYLMSSGHPDEAIARMREALGLYEKLIGEQPDSEDLLYRKAWTLVNLAQALWGKPDHAQGAQRAIEATDLLRQLTTRKPTYRPGLAQWLVFPAGTYLMVSGRHDEAIARMREALGLFDKLIGEQPGSEDLLYRKAWALVNLAQALWGKPDHAQGAQRAIEATDLLRQLATANPGRYRGGLGDWLMFPTIPYLRQSGRRDDALTRAREAVDIFTALNATDPAVYGPKLAAAKKLVADIQAELPSG
ncbi:tetratricopeptide repeat protein [Streptomyces botrytidirepellens]|uniref:Tetratricopeptide repeat protein n=1 Tax=Streptomyces botrytidirepellens TaxID=2486417 RepID=A0A3M8XCV4_9ACTN|nr:tetratricopeptide repeat protein [Streptomyces botrytidirepellens]RNG38595.1 tetratricopeptide repeat protein [Streptomyces botrytidirepellens]